MSQASETGAAPSPWKTLEEKLLHQTKIFELYSRRLLFPDGTTEADFYLLKCKGWTSVVALNKSGDLVLVRQFRHGIQQFCLEAAGGLIDDGEDFQEAAKREFEEETGYVAEQFLPLGILHPNPAMFDNSCYFFLALGVEQTKEQKLEATEDITVEVIPLQEIREMILRGELNHSLLYSALLLALVKFPEQMKAFWNPVSR